MKGHDAAALVQHNRAHHFAIRLDSSSVFWSSYKGKKKRANGIIVFDNTGSNYKVSKLVPAHILVPF